MRTCPVCESKHRNKKWKQTFLVPQGWTQPEYLDWVTCKSCGMIYADNPDLMQSDYDHYYKERYGFGVEDAEATARQKEHAVFCVSVLKDKNIKIIDFGGAGVLSVFLKEYGFTDVTDVGAGEGLPQGIGVMFAEHVLEHIYNLPDTMRLISKAVVAGGMLVVDGPEASGISTEKATPMLDFHQKHINHFTFYDYLHLMRRHNFDFAGAQNYLERKNPCVHILFGKSEPDRVINESLAHIQPNIAEIVRGLKELENKPVVVWGCGDIALHALSIHFPNVRYFVDKDPAFREQSIKGRWVMDRVQEGETCPIVVIAQGQRQDILQNIKAEGLKNQVIIL